jgi:hypothetical protein
MFAVFTFAWHHLQTPWWEKAQDLSQMLASQRSGAGYEGTDEYVPVMADPYEINKDAPRVITDNENATPAQAQPIHIERWDAESKLFAAETSQPEQLALRLFNYPAWRVEVNSKVVAPATQDVTGRMLIPLQAGENRVQIMFSRTWDRTLGGIVSGVTALFFGGLVAFTRLRTGAHTRDLPT